MPEIDEELLHRTGVKFAEKIVRSPGDPRATKVYVNDSLNGSLNW